MPSNRDFALAAIAVALGVVSIAAYYRRRAATGNGKRKLAHNPITVTQLWVYPVKSCGGMPLTHSTLTKHGFKYDRSWVVVRRRDNAVLTQRELPQMKLIAARIDEPAGLLWLSSESDGSVEVSLAPPSPPADAEKSLVRLEKWGLYGDFREVGEEKVGNWLSAVLGENVYLAQCVTARNPNDVEKHRLVLHPEDRIQGHDFSTLHVISEEGLEWIRGQTADPTINSSRFRPNIVVSGTQWPAEDQWLDFTVGDVRLRSAKGASRCSIPTIDDSAKMNLDFQPTKTLREQHAMPAPYDLEGKAKPIFGLNVFHDDLGEIRIGDSLVVRSERK